VVVVGVYGVEEVLLGVEGEGEEEEQK